jgi:hypothetical protein
MARAASQSTIHPLDTMKVRMQAGGGRAASSSSGGSKAPSLPPKPAGTPMQSRLHEVKGLYKVGAACWMPRQSLFCTLLLSGMHAAARITSQ